MSVTALFRGRWGQKSQETHEKQPAAVVQPNQGEESDEDDSKVGFSREPIRRNSRFYRSMRKKRECESKSLRWMFSPVLTLLMFVMSDIS